MDGWMEFSAETPAGNITPDFSLLRMHPQHDARQETGIPSVSASLAVHANNLGFVDELCSFPKTSKKSFCFGVSGVSLEAAGRQTLADRGSRTKIF
jgi:hypothetical protein